MMKRVVAVLAAVILGGSPLLAQQIDFGSISANSSGGGCTGTANSCAAFLPGTASSVTLQVTGTFVGTLTFEASSDANQTNWFTVSGTNVADGSTASTTTATGQFAFNNSGFTGLRARATAWTSGTATVTAARGYATARWLTPFFSSIKVADGTSGAPSMAFASEPTLGFWRSAAATITAQGSLLLPLNSAVLGFTNGAKLFSPVDGHLRLLNAATNIGSLIKVDALPTAGTCGTSPAVTAGSTPFAGSINVGTGGTATSCTVTFNGTAYPSAPFCTLGQSAGTFTTYTATTTVLTLSAAVAWPASTVVTWNCPSAK